MTLQEWIDYGVEHGYARSSCYTHDGAVLTEEEEELWEEGEDPCVPMLRVFL